MKTYAKILHSLYALVFLIFLCAGEVFASRMFILQGSDKYCFIYRNMSSGELVSIPFSGILFNGTDAIDTLNVGDSEGVRHHWLKNGLGRLEGSNVLAVERRLERRAQLAHLGIWSGWRKVVQKKDVTAQFGISPSVRARTSPVVGERLNTQDLNLKFLRLENERLYFQDLAVAGDVYWIWALNVKVDYSLIQDFRIPRGKDLRLFLIENGCIGLKMPKLAAESERRADMAAKKNRLGIWRYYDGTSGSKAYFLAVVPIVPGDTVKPGWFDRIKIYCKQRYAQLKKINGNVFGGLMVCLGLLLTPVADHFIKKWLNKPKDPRVIINNLVRMIVFVSIVSLFFYKYL